MRTLSNADEAIRVRRGSSAISAVGQPTGVHQGGKLGGALGGWAPKREEGLTEPCRAEAVREHEQLLLARRLLLEQVERQPQRICIARDAVLPVSEAQEQ